MTFEEWWNFTIGCHSSEQVNCVAKSSLVYDRMKMAYEAGYKARVLDELVEKGQDFDEYGHYGENNGPVGMSNPGDRDYEC